MVVVVVVLLVVIALGIAGCVYLVRRRRHMERVRNSPARLRGSDYPSSYDMLGAWKGNLWVAFGGQC